VASIRLFKTSFLSVILLAVSCLLALSGCSHTSPGELVADAAGFVLVEAAEAEAVDKCRVQNRADASCEREFREDLEKGQVLYQEQKNASGGHPKEMSEEFEDYVDEMLSERQTDK
jgi:hypothetical protein